MLSSNNTINENNFLSTITPSRNLDLIASLNVQQSNNNTLSYFSRIQAPQQNQQQRLIANEDLLVFPYSKNNNIAANYLFDNSISGK